MSTQTTAPQADGVGERRGEVQTVKNAHRSTVDVSGPSSTVVLINSMHERACRSALDALESARECGGLLIKAKARFPHGVWSKWLAENITFSERTAQRYMKLAAGWESLQTKTDTVSDLTVGAAIRLLAAPKPKARPVTGKSRIESTTGTTATSQEAVEEEVEDAARLKAERAAADRGWLNRALEAAQYARYAPAETCPKTRKVVRAVEDAITAWSAVLSHRLPPARVEDQEDEEVEDAANYRTSFLLRAEQAIRFATHSGPVTADLIATARAVAKAWAQLADRLEKTNS